MEVEAVNPLAHAPSQITANFSVEGEPWQILNAGGMDPPLCPRLLQVGHFKQGHTQGLASKVSHECGQQLIKKVFHLRCASSLSAAMSC